MGESGLEERISNAHYKSKAEFERSSKVFARRIVPDAPALCILDVGCGTGLNARHLKAKGHQIFGIDISPVAIEKFRENGFEGSVCNIEQVRGVPRPDGSFDLVFASEVIEHVVDTASVLAEIHRLLRPGGTLVLSTPNSAFWAYRILALAGQGASESQHPGHVRFFSRRSLTAAIKAAKFDIAAVSGRHIYCVCGSGIGDAIGPILRFLGFRIEPRFATGGHFWQIGGFASRASGIWADTFIVVAHKPDGRN